MDRNHTLPTQPAIPASIWESICNRDSISKTASVLDTGTSGLTPVGYHDRAPLVCLNQQALERCILVPTAPRILLSCEPSSLVMKDYMQKTMQIYCLTTSCRLNMIDTLHVCPGGDHRENERTAREDGRHLRAPLHNVWPDVFRHGPNSHT